MWYSRDWVRHLVENLLVCRSQRDKEYHRMIFELCQILAIVALLFLARARISIKSLFLKNANYMIKLLNVIKCRQNTQ